MITITTERLLNLFRVLMPTVNRKNHGAGIPGVLLHTARGEYGSEPGRTTLLAGTTSNGLGAGHTVIPCDGQLEPTLITLDDVATLRAWLGPRAKKNAEHSVEITRDLTSITVAEPPDLFDQADEVTLHVKDLDDVPRGLWDLLDPANVFELGAPDNVHGQALPNTHRVDITADMLLPFLTVGKMLGEEVQLYQQHSQRPILVQIGGSYRGVLTPRRWGADLRPDRVRIEGAAPDGPVHAPDLPPVKKKTTGPIVLAFGSKPAPVQQTIPEDFVAEEDVKPDPIEQAATDAKSSLLRDGTGLAVGKSAADKLVQAAEAHKIMRDVENKPAAPAFTPDQP
jgi:hypothetical protein